MAAPRSCCRLHPQPRAETKPAVNKKTLWRRLNWFEGFQVLTAAGMKKTDFCDIAPCSLVVVDRRVSGVYCLHHQGPDYAGSTHLRNVGLLQQDYKAQYPSRLSSSGLKYMTKAIHSEVFSSEILYPT
jgi:hypothetical protein